MSNPTVFPENAQPINQNDRSRLIGVTSTQGGLAIFDEPFVTNGSDIPQVSSKIHVATGGTLLLEMCDGSVLPKFGLLNGGWVLAKATRVLTSAVLSDGNTYTTTCDGVTWEGGQ